LAQLDVDAENPTLLARIEGTKLCLIIDKGSSASLIQPGVCSEVVATTNLSPYGVTGDALDVRGEQRVAFWINNVKYEHKILVCSLPTTAAGILGMNFLLKCGVEINFGKAELKLQDFSKFRHGSRKRRG
jgi:hypothetical protein